MVIHIMVIHVVVVAALPLRLFQFMTALTRLFTVLAVTLHCVPQLVFRLVNAPIAFVVRARRG
ncbi:MAG: hypothetical protein WBV31_11025 [Terriglobales bacterium]